MFESRGQATNTVVEKSKSCTEKSKLKKKHEENCLSLEKPDESQRETQVYID